MIEKTIHAIPTPFTCTDCNGVIHVTNQFAYSLLLSGRKTRCNHCQRKFTKDYTAMSYDNYLKTERWKDLANKCRHYWGYRCALCYSDGELHVHHRTYERRGRELDTDLIALCDVCHDKFHKGDEQCQVVDNPR